MAILAYFVLALFPPQGGPSKIAVWGPTLFHAAVVVPRANPMLDKKLAATRDRTGDL